MDQPKFELTYEMNFCRRCGSKLTQRDFAHVYQCKQGHTIFANASPAVGMVVLNDQNQVLIIERAIDPGKGRLDVPGGFCDGAESLEEGMIREMEEEVGLSPADYGEISYILSGIDPYEYKGEVLPVCSVLYLARVKGEVILTPADDAASASFVSFDELDLDKVQFPSVRLALERARDMFAQS